MARDSLTEVLTAGSSPSERGWASFCTISSNPPADIDKPPSQDFVPVARTPRDGSLVHEPTIQSSAIIIATIALSAHIDPSQQTDTIKRCPPEVAGPAFSPPSPGHGTPSMNSVSYSRHPSPHQVCLIPCMLVGSIARRVTILHMSSIGPKRIISAWDPRGTCLFSGPHSVFHARYDSCTEEWLVVSRRRATLD